jgi:hypothetical protein
MYISNTLFKKRHLIKKNKIILTYNLVIKHIRFSLTFYVV